MLPERGPAAGEKVMQSWVDAFLPGWLAFARICSAGRPSTVQAELANHAIQVAGQRGKILERVDGFFGALCGFRGELRDLPG
jgi:hypothetical protein